MQDIQFTSRSHIDIKKALAFLILQALNRTTKEITELLDLPPWQWNHLAGPYFVRLVFPVIEVEKFFDISRGHGRRLSGNDIKALMRRYLAARSIEAIDDEAVTSKDGFTTAVEQMCEWVNSHLEECGLLHNPIYDRLPRIENYRPLSSGGRVLYDRIGRHESRDNRSNYSEDGRVLSDRIGRNEFPDDRSNYQDGGRVLHDRIGRRESRDIESDHRGDRRVLSDRIDRYESRDDRQHTDEGDNYDAARQNRQLCDRIEPNPSRSARSLFDRIAPDSKSRNSRESSRSNSRKPCSDQSLHVAHSPIVSTPAKRSSTTPKDPVMQAVIQAEIAIARKVCPARQPSAPTTVPAPTKNDSTRPSPPRDATQSTAASHSASVKPDGRMVSPASHISRPELDPAPPARPVKMEKASPSLPIAENPSKPDSRHPDATPSEPATFGPTSVSIKQLTTEPHRSNDNTLVPTQAVALEPHKSIEVEMAAGAESVSSEATTDQSTITRMSALSTTPQLTPTSSCTDSKRIEPEEEPIGLGSSVDMFSDLPGDLGHVSEAGTDATYHPGLDQPSEPDESDDSYGDSDSESLSLELENLQVPSNPSTPSVSGSPVAQKKLPKAEKLKENIASTKPKRIDIGITKKCDFCTKRKFEDAKKRRYHMSYQCRKNPAVPENKAKSREKRKARASAQPSDTILPPIEDLALAMAREPKAVPGSTIFHQCDYCSTKLFESDGQRLLHMALYCDKNPRSKVCILAAQASLPPETNDARASTPVQASQSVKPMQFVLPEDSSSEDELAIVRALIGKPTEKRSLPRDMNANTAPAKSSKVTAKDSPGYQRGGPEQTRSISPRTVKAVTKARRATSGTQDSSRSAPQAFTSNVPFPLNSAFSLQTDVMTNANSAEATFVTGTVQTLSVANPHSIKSTVSEQVLAATPELLEDISTARVAAISRPTSRMQVDPAFQCQITVPAARATTRAISPKVSPMYTSALPAQEPQGASMTTGTISPMTGSEDSLPLAKFFALDPSVAVSPTLVVRQDPTSSIVPTALKKEQWESIAVLLSIRSKSRLETRARIEAHIDKKCQFVNLSRNTQAILDLFMRHVESDPTEHNKEMLQNVILLYCEEGHKDDWQRRIYDYLGRHDDDNWGMLLNRFLDL